MWRHVEKKGKRVEKADKKAAIKKCTQDGIPVGILAYIDKQAVAWCSVAPRQTYKNLNGIETDKNIWSIVCFFIKRSYRNMGLNRLLLSEAIKYARANGAEMVEAYPVESDSPSYRFMGIKPAFEKARFRFIKEAGSRRHVMLLDLYDNIK